VQESIDILDALSKTGRLSMEQIWRLLGEMDEGVWGQTYPDLPQTMDAFIRFLCECL